VSILGWAATILGMLGGIWVLYWFITQMKALQRRRHAEIQELDAIILEIDRKVIQARNEIIQRKRADSDGQTT